MHLRIKEVLILVLQVIDKVICFLLDFFLCLNLLISPLRKQFNARPPTGALFSRLYIR